MSKKRLSENQKLRREVELLRAQIKSESANVSKLFEQPKVILSTDSKALSLDNMSRTSESPSRSALPLKEIKKDLVRIGIYTVVSITLVIVLGVFNFKLF